ncbi:MAG: hypothetical protein R3C99_02780 [Pirellulaceae bacterium]
MFRRLLALFLAVALAAEGAVLQPLHVHVDGAHADGGRCGHVWSIAPGSASKCKTGRNGYAGPREGSYSQADCCDHPAGLEYRQQPSPSDSRVPHQHDDHCLVCRVLHQAAELPTVTVLVSLPTLVAEVAVLELPCPATSSLRVAQPRAPPALSV